MVLFVAYMTRLRNWVHRIVKFCLFGWAISVVQVGIHLTFFSGYRGQHRTLQICRTHTRTSPSIRTHYCSGRRAWPDSQPSWDHRFRIHALLWFKVVALYCQIWKPSWSVRVNIPERCSLNNSPSGNLLHAAPIGTFSNYLNSFVEAIMMRHMSANAQLS